MSSDWEELRTETGEVYYYNYKTNETSWTLPETEETLPVSEKQETITTSTTTGKWEEYTTDDGKSIIIMQLLEKQHGKNQMR